MGLFYKEPTFDPATDLPDLSGKVVIVTGGNSGIGFGTVQHLARHGAKVYLAARSEIKAKAAIERLRAEGLEPGNGELEFLGLDLSDPRKAKKSAEAFIAREKRLDVLVNNAGMLRSDYALSDDGIVHSMEINHFAPFAFTQTLLPLLSQTAKEPESDVRVVFVSSGSIRMLKGRELHFKEVDDFNEKFGTSGLAQMYRYAKSKFAGLLYANELQRKLDAEGTPVTVIALHPGAVHTEGVQNDPSMKRPIFGPALNFILSKIFATSSVGAYTSAFAAGSAKVKAEREKYKGAFLWPYAGQIGEQPTPEASSEQLAQELWNTTERLMKQWGV